MLLQVRNKTIIGLKLRSIMRGWKRLIMVRNKTIIGLKFATYSSKEGCFWVRNKTIIGLKY